MFIFTHVVSGTTSKSVGLPLPSVYLFVSVYPFTSFLNKDLIFIYRHILSIVLISCDKLSRYCLYISLVYSHIGFLTIYI